MKYGFLFLALISLVLVSCEESFETKSYPKLITLDAVDVDSTGATFKCEVLDAGTSLTTSYGFLWSTEVEPDMNNSKKKVLGTVVPENGFSTRIDSLFYTGIDYYIRAFATFGKKTVYGRTRTVTSQGCITAWKKMLSNVTLTGSGNPYGSSNNVTGHILFQNGLSYKYDPELNKFSTSTKFPSSFLNREDITAVSVPDCQYFYNKNDWTLYKLKDNEWSIHSKVPLNLNIMRYRFENNNLVFFGCIYLNTLYLLNEETSFAYHIETNSWEILEPYPLNYSSSIFAGCYLNGKAYLLNRSAEIYEYDIATNKWHYKTKFPGSTTQGGNMLSFSYDNKLYFGLNENDKKIRSYDLITDKWKELEPFPEESAATNRFYIRINGNIYIGYAIAGKYDLYKLDLSKLEGKH